MTSKTSLLPRAGLLFVMTEPSLMVARVLLYGYVVSRLLHFAAYFTARTHDTRATLWTIGSLILIFMTSGRCRRVGLLICVGSFSSYVRVLANFSDLRRCPVGVRRASTRGRGQAALTDLELRVHALVWATPCHMRCR